MSAKRVSFRLIAPLYEKLTAYLAKKWTFATPGPYKADGTGGQPGTLAFDAGAMAQSIAAQNDVVIAQTVEQGWYWPALVVDTACTVNAIGSSDVSGFFSGYADGNSESSRLTVAHTYGALPNPFGTVTYTTASSQPHFLLKV